MLLFMDCHAVLTAHNDKQGTKSALFRKKFLSFFTQNSKFLAELKIL